MKQKAACELQSFHHGSIKKLTFWPGLLKVQPHTILAGFLWLVSDFISLYIGSYFPPDQKSAMESLLIYFDKMEERRENVRNNYAMCKRVSN